MESINVFAKKYVWLVPLILRFGLAIVFILFGIHKLQAPSQTTAEIQYILGFEKAEAAAPINFYMGLFEIAISISLIIGFQVRLAGLLAALTTLAIFVSFTIKIGSLFSIDPGIYRDLGLSGMGLALFFIGKNETKKLDTQPQVSATSQQ